MTNLGGVPRPLNEPVLTYAPGTPERTALAAALEELASAPPVEFTAAIAGERRRGRGEHTLTVQMPSDHRRVLGTIVTPSRADVERAVAGAVAVARMWEEVPFEHKAAIFLKAADLLAGPYRARINAATMLGQGKTVQQAEIDSACELIDFLRFNVHYAERIFAEQPVSVRGVWNRTDYRPLGGFVYAVTPFNFTAIAGNLPTAPAILGNPVVWKPAVTQQLAADVFLEVLEAAGLPAGVISMLPGHGQEVSEVVLASPDLAGIHFTGSTRVFQGLWSEVGRRIASYRTYPRLVGETGGKDFVLAHPSADPDALVTALVRGAFEYSGQKCSAASRAYIPKSLWRTMGARLAEETDALAVGDVRDFANFTSALIDERAFDKVTRAIERARGAAGNKVVAGGTYDKSDGWFVRPTIVTATDPTDDLFVTEYFGPLLGIHVYDDGDFEKVLGLVDTASPYALTGAILATDRTAIDTASRALRHTAGNFYINDKPTGAVVGQQPFGGGRASGTNDKAGSLWNLIRWTSPRSIKETFVPPTSTGYPHMG